MMIFVGDPLQQAMRSVNVPMYDEDGALLELTPEGVWRARRAGDAQVVFEAEGKWDLPCSELGNAAASSCSPQR